MVTKRHFETFDALRFLAFFKVFLYHLPFSHWPLFNSIKAGGDLGVRLFYVLSGFLITYIIAEEKQQTGRLNFKHFMVRRILRIWPLYYLMVAFAYLTPLIMSYWDISHSDDGYVPQLFFSLTFLENYKAIIAGQGANVSPLPVMWSVCVEEHFYLVWGLLLCFINIRHIPKVAIICTAVALISRSIFVILGYSRLDLLTNFDLFAIGAVPAYLLITRPAKFEAAINGIDKGMKGFYLVLVIATVQIMPFFRSPASEIFAPFLVAVLFTFLLSMFLPRGSTFGLGDDNWLSRLGKYTYALYLFHTVVINLLSRLSAAADLSLDRVDTAALFFALALGLCILASVVSYSLIERPFLQLKRLFY